MNPLKTIALALAIAAALAASSPARASSSSGFASSAAANPFVPIEDAQRVLQFESHRQWSDVDGLILVCPLSVALALCRNRQLGPHGPWVALNSLKIPGHRMVGIQHFFSSSLGTSNLLVYFAKDAR